MSKKIIIKTKEELKILFKEYNTEIAINETSEEEYKTFCDTFNDVYDYSSITDMSFLFRVLVI